MIGQKYKHVTNHNRKFTFQLKVIGLPLYPGEHWETEEDAACAADLTKHYFRTWFHVSKSMVPSLDPELFTVMAYRLNVNLSDSLSVLKACPPGVSLFMMNHRHEMDAFAEANRPERKAWEILRADPCFNSNPFIRSWVQDCERAELDVMAFGSLNGEYLLTLLTGLVGRFEDLLSPLRKAVKMHGSAMAGSVKLDERREMLTALLRHLEADLAYVSALPANVREQEASVKLAMTALENSRPAVY